jgi:hypothetical protein
MAEDLLDRLLRDQDTDTREKVLQIVHASGIRESDPVFLLMVANSTVQVLLEQAPNELRQTFHDCHQRTRDEYESWEKASLAGIKHEISKTTNQLVAEAIAKGNEAKSVVTYKSLIGAGAMLLATLLVGGVCGLGAARWIAQMDDRGLTAEQIKALEWGQSNEGRFAQQFFAWNPDLLNRECEARARDLGAIRVNGRTYTSGYCFLWTQPPDERGFEE